MKLSSSWLCIALACCCTHAEEPLAARTNVNPPARPTPPSCATNCTDQISRASFPCEPTEPCYCDDHSERSRSLLACLRANCTLDEAFAAKAIQAETCGFPRHDFRSALRATIYPLFAVAVLLTIARLLSRYPPWHGAGIWWDDLVVLICMAPIAILPVDAEIELRYGLGQDMWTQTGHEITRFLMWFYIAEPLYIVATRLTKLSLLLLYVRIWPDRSTPFWHACAVVGTLLALSIPAALFPAVFQCRPVSYYWTRLMHTTGACVDQTDLSIANATIVIAFDLAVLLLPVYNVARLRVSVAMRVGVASIFLIGLAVTACSIVRLTFIMRYSQASANVTYDYRGLAMWSHIEVYLSLICCSMPQMPGLLRRIWVALKTGPATTGRLESASGLDNERTHLWGDKYTPSPHIERS